MNRSKELLATYVSDLLALERHLYEALDRQAGDSAVLDYPQAKALIDRLHTVAKTHRDGLDVHLRALGSGHPAATLKEALTTVLGMAAGVLDKVRPYSISKMLRDDYTALSMAAISYTMLHTAALGFKETATAELARQHLQDWTPLIVEISETIPSVVVREFERDSLAVDPSAVSEGLKNTHAAWRREAMDKAA